MLQPRWEYCSCGWAGCQTCERMSENLTSRVDALRAQLREVTGRVRPFPTFLGRNWLEAVEVELGDGVVMGIDKGCVVVCPDGELYELALRLLPGAEVVSDPNPAEELTPLAVPDTEYVAWAEAALKTLRAYLK